jgi:hypothetical protein
MRSAASFSGTSRETMAGDLPPSSRVTGCEVFGGGAHHMLADAGGAGEQQMIEAQPGERHADVGFTEHHADQVFGENPRQQLP